MGESTPQPQSSESARAAEHTYESVTSKVSRIILARRFYWYWWSGVLVAFVLAGVFIYGVGYLFSRGVGIWGINIPVAWGFAITNYVWWIGIGMGGTFISAALLLAGQEWRTSVNRIAETMTVIAVAISALFPIMHLGRPWFFYWLAPYPNRMGVWPQWRSPLVWDFWAVSAYLVTSILFWYIGMLPDLATLRDRAKTHGRQIFYGLLAIGWRGEARDWQRHTTAQRLLAGLAVPMVFTVHSMVAMDFDTGITPGWHSTIFPPFFVAGALFSGFAMMLTIAVVLRSTLHLQDVINSDHLDKMAKVVLATSLVMAYSYGVEMFKAFYSQDQFELYLAINRTTGPYSPLYWGTIICNAIIPQVLWSSRARHNMLVLFFVGAIIVIGMWLERFMLIVTSLHREFLPSDWGMFYPTAWDWAILFGSIGLFFLLLLLFVRFLPSVSIFEQRLIVFRREAQRE